MRFASTRPDPSRTCPCRRCGSIASARSWVSNLSSLLEAPQIGRQTFTVTEITTSEPDPSFFQPPQGYKVVDHRKGFDVE